jgi:hypothetical protein
VLVRLPRQRRREAVRRGPFAGPHATLATVLRLCRTSPPARPCSGRDRTSDASESHRRFPTRVSALQTEGKAELTVELADVERITAAWPGPQQNVARQMLAKYGQPNEATPTRLFWHRNHHWKRTELTSDAVVHHWPAPHTDFLTKYINYRVPPEQAHLVAMFDGSILMDRTRDEVAARCDSEAANVLGLNMVYELVTGERTVEEARHTSKQSTVAYNLGREAAMPSGCCSRCPGRHRRFRQEPPLQVGAAAGGGQAQGRGHPWRRGGNRRPSHPKLTHGRGLLALRTVKRRNAIAWASE